MPLARLSRSRLVIGSVALATLGTAGFAYAATGALSDHGGARRLSGDQTAAVTAAINPGKAKNVILLIGDGMGDSEITSARNYAKGAAGSFAGIDALPLTGQYTTYSLKKDGKPDYVPDSAATGTAWATGTKTYDNAVSVDIAGKAQQTLLELAKTKGLKTGNVTTSELQDATPAVQISHISARSCYGPVQVATTCPEARLETGGLGSITEQLLATRADVTLGGGATTFSQTATGGAYAGKTLMQQATERGYQMVTDKAGLAAVTSADQSKPLLGLFANGNMPVRYTGPAATRGGDALPAAKCVDNTARPATQPTLAEMTDKAIKLLDNPKGFFLQVEGASIDKQDHAADACGQIGEVVDLDEAVQVALAYAKKVGNTSVFVTADHAHTSQIVEVVPTGTTSTTPGLTVALQTADDSPMAISYATAPQGGSQQHTGTQLRIAGYGPKAANIVGLTDQTDLFYTINEALYGTDTTPVPTPVPSPTSSKARVQVLPAKVDRGQKVVVLGKEFGGDSQVKVVITGGGKKIKKTLDVKDGLVVLTIKGKKAGKYAVVITGVQSSVSKKEGFVVRR